MDKDTQGLAQFTLVCWCINLACWLWKHGDYCKIFDQTTVTSLIDIIWPLVHTIASFLTGILLLGIAFG